MSEQLVVLLMKFMCLCKCDTDMSNQFKVVVNKYGICNNIA